MLRISDLEKAGATIRHIETRIRQAVPQVDRVVIHAEPMQRTHLCYVVPLDDRAGTVSEHLGDAPFFALLRCVRATTRLRSRRFCRTRIRSLIEAKASGLRSGWWSKRPTWSCSETKCMARAPSMSLAEQGSKCERPQPRCSPR